MSYYSYLPLIKDQVRRLDHPPAFLEVGLDRGATFLSLVTFMARTCPEFLAVGVDVLVQDHIGVIIGNLDLLDKQRVFLHQDSSLSELPRLAGLGNRFDVVMLDGDHNYHTVSAELGWLPSLVRPDGAVIIDDYNGRWSETDAWYSERPGYEDVKPATQRVDTLKHGVKPAVDDWLAAHPDWQISKQIPGDAVVLARRHT